MEHVLSLLSEAMAIQNAVSGKIRLAAPASTDLELFAQRGLSESFTKTFARISPSDAAPSAVAYSLRRRVIVTDVPRDARASLYARASSEEGFSAMQSTPIFGVGGDVIGAL